MATTGKVKTLFSDKEKTEALFPRTKVSAVSDANGVGLDALMEGLMYSGVDNAELSAVPLNADTLGGKPLSDFMTNGKTGNLKYSDVGAASGAYGLGASVNWDCPSANDIQVTGFYTCNVDVPSNAYWYGMHIRYDANSAYQYFVHAEQHYCAERRKINGVWQPWEWVNPPMTFGIEYRTTERYNGNPVYVKAVDLQTLPNNAEKIVRFDGVAAFVVELHGFTTYDGLFYDLAQIAGVISYQASRNDIRITTNKDLSAWTGYAIVKYTKG